MAKRYTRINWENRPSIITPINATNLNKMDKAIDDLDNAIEDIYNEQLPLKVDKADGMGLTANDYTNTDKAKVNNLPNDTSQALSQMSNSLDYLSQNQLSIIDDVNAIGNVLPNKVDKVDGKGLSSNDYTTTDKNKVSKLPDDTLSQLAAIATDFDKNKKIEKRINSTLGKLQECIPDFSLFTTGASAGNTRFSGNATTIDGQLISISVKAVRSGVCTICLATEFGGNYTLLTSFSATLSVGENILINGVHFTFDKIVPKGTIVGLYAVNNVAYPALFYYTDGTLSRTYNGDFSQTSGNINLPTASYNVSIGLTIYAPTTTMIESQYMNKQVDTLTSATLEIPQAIGAIKKNLNLSFFANVTSFELIRIGYKAENNTVYDRLTIDGTNVTVQNVNSDNVATYPHGLTITNTIAVLIKMKYDETADITIMANGGIYTKNVSWFRMIAPTYPYIIASTSTMLTNCKLSWTSEDFNKLIYAYGDSYFNYADTRWMYYVNQYGYMDNMLVNAFPGAGSVNVLKALNADLKCGKPKFVLWTLGMNDGSDNASDPNATWLTSIQAVLSICDARGIIPILATVPTVPTRNHEKKNEWIRNSGYKYIDFAKAVGADASGNWYSGMLETGAAENVHPSALGAKALFMRACVDFPQMMIK